MASEYNAFDIFLTKGKGDTETNLWKIEKNSKFEIKSDISDQNQFFFTLLSQKDFITSTY